MELCDACEGTGLLGFQRETCWFCGGTGKKKGGKQMDRQKVLDVLNSLEVIETNGGDEPYILVENNEKNRQLLNSVGISDEIISKYNNLDDDTICIFSIAFGERYANWYENGRFVWLNKAEMAKVFEKYLEEALDQICQKCGFFCTVDPDYERGQIVINVVSE